MSVKDNSLLEIAIDLLKKKRSPQNINTIIKEVMSLKGYRVSQVKEATPQFVMDFMLSGYFIYCGDDCWDLKDRQPTTLLDKDGGDYEDIFFNDDDVKNNELKDDDLIFPPEAIIAPEVLAADDDDEEETDEEEDDLANEFEVVAYTEEDDDDDMDEDEK